MPAKSKSQYRYMKAVEHGSIQDSSLTKSQAKEFTKENKGKKRFSKIKEKVCSCKK